MELRNYWESVYGIAIEGEIIYIGRAINPAMRFYTHIYKCRCLCPKRPLYRYLKMQIQSNIFPELVILCVDRSRNIGIMENQMIKKYAASGLFNIMGNMLQPNDYPFICDSAFSEKAIAFFRSVYDNSVPTKYPIR